MVQILHASISDIPVIKRLAEETWWPTYSPILSMEQIRYMLDHVYDKDALEKVMRSGAQIFLLLYENQQPQAFAAYGLKPDNASICKLHKLYVLPDNHGKGFGRMLIQEVINRIKPSGIELLDLNVNKYNKAKNFYERLGFKIVKEEDVPVGPYWMNDYVMRLHINNFQSAGEKVKS
jgi:diamine N-acetyltransferase